jgi:hypothetical protein
MPQRFDFRPNEPAPEVDRTAVVTHGLDGETHVEFRDDADPLLRQMVEKRIEQSYGNCQRPGPLAPAFLTAGPAPESRDGELVGRATGMAAKSLSELHRIYTKPRAAEGASRCGSWSFPVTKPAGE